MNQGEQYDQPRSTGGVEGEKKGSGQFTRRMFGRRRVLVWLKQSLVDECTKVNLAIRMWIETHQLRVGGSGDLG